MPLQPKEEVFDIFFYVFLLAMLSIKAYFRKTKNVYVSTPYQKSFKIQDNYGFTIFNEFFKVTKNTLCTECSKAVSE